MFPRARMMVNPYHNPPERPSKVTFHTLPTRVLSRKPAEHRRATRDRVRRRRREDDGHATHVREELHELRVLRLPARHVQRPDLVSGPVHRVDDVPRLERERLEREVELPGEVVQGPVELEPGDGAGHGRVGDWRAVACFFC